MQVETLLARGSHGVPEKREKENHREGWDGEDENQTARCQRCGEREKAARKLRCRRPRLGMQLYIISRNSSVRTVAILQDARDG